MLKVKNITKYDTYEAKEGIGNTGESMCNKSQAEDVDIYKCIEKYGVEPLMRQSMAKEQLYLDNTLRFNNLQDAINAKNQMEEYYNQLPARVRKVFGDNIDVFYEKYRNNEFEDMINYGILSKDQANEIIKGAIDEYELETGNKIDNNNNTSNSEGNNTNL